MSAKTDQNLKFFFDLSALNHCKRSQRRVRFVWAVLCTFEVIIDAENFENRAKSSKFQSKKDTKSSKSHSESIFGIPLLGAPPAPAGLVLVYFRWR